MKRPARTPRIPRPASNLQPIIDVKLPLREILGSLTLSDTAVIAWFKLAPTPWAFLSNSQREGVLHEGAVARSHLAGRRVHLRVTQRPYPIAEWAKNLDQHERTNPPNRDEWVKHLTRTQNHLDGASLANNETYMGVEIAPRAMVDKIAAATRKGNTSEREIRRIQAETLAVESAMAMPGLSAVHATHDELVWLIHQSVGLMIPGAPQTTIGGRIETTDLATFTDSIEFAPDGDLIKITSLDARRGTGPITRWVAILSIGRMEELTIPEKHHPWLAFAQNLGFRVEISAHIQYLTGKEALGGVRRKLDMVKDQLDQYRAHSLDPLPEVLIVGEQARSLRHDLEEGDPLTSTQVHGVYRLAVAGRTRQDALERVQQVRDHYSKQRIEIEHPRGQRGLYEEFCPGATRATTAHTRHFGLAFDAASLPTLDESLGDGVGEYLGYTNSSVVMWDPHRGMFEGETTGLIPVIGKPGSGKSTLIAKIVRDAAVKGVSTTVLDPAGLLARLCEAPELKDISHHIDLATAADGALSPWTAIPTPARSNFKTLNDYTEACKAVVRERRLLAIDIAQMLLPIALQEDSSTELALMSAAKVLDQTVIRSDGRVGPASMFDLIESLEANGGQHARTIATHLRDMSDLPMARLIFPVGNSTENAALGDDATLLVLTMDGIVLPNIDANPRTYTTGERIAIPLLQLAAHLATRRIYSRPMNEPKLVALDEVHWLARWSSGRSLFQNLGRNNRKWRTCVLAASQTPHDILDQKVGNLIAQAFIGRLEDEDAQRDALKMLCVRPGIGYEAHIASLSPVSASGKQSATRDFIMRDATGRVGKVAIDLGNVPSVRDAVTPKRTARRSQTDPETLQTPEWVQDKVNA